MRATLIPTLICAALSLPACSAMAPQSAAPLPVLSDVDLPGGAAAGQAALTADAARAALEADAGLAGADGVGRPAQARAGDAPEGGLLGFFRRQGDAARAPAARSTEERASERVLASLPEENRAAPAPNASPGGGFLSGLFGGGSSGSGGGTPSALSEVGPNEVVPQGSMARLCGVDVARLAGLVDTHRRYRLYDTEIGSTAPRNWYVTGFDDGCARQFTAALALFGTVETHESLRYGPAAKDLPMTATDEAYKAAKSRICRVGRNAPCGPRIGRLDRTSVFLTIYAQFGGNARWVNAFLHDGDVAAVDIASN